MKKISLFIALTCMTSAAFADVECNLQVLINGQRKALHSYPDITNIKIGGFENRIHGHQLKGYNLLYTYTYKKNETMVGYINFNENCNGLDGSDLKAE